MSNLNRHPVKRAAVGVLAGTLALSGGALVAGISPANALPGFTFDRLAGVDRFATAAAIATDRFGTSAPDVILANGINFPDALAGNYLAGFENAPILLTLPNNLVAPTKDALAALNTDNIRIVGGTSAISQAVQNELVALGYNVTRVAGTDRYKTAAAIAADPGNANVGSIAAGRTAIVANGEGFADALTAGPLSVDQSFPILLTQPAALRPEANGALDSLEIDNVLIVGGTAAVSPAVEAAIVAKGITVTRLAGVNRSATAVAIADYAITNLGFSDTHVNLARGDNGPSNDGFADALSGGPHAGAEAAPIVLTLTPTSNAPETLAFLEANSGTLVDGHIFGGTAAVSLAVETEAAAAAAGTAPATNASFGVTPTAGQIVQLDANDDAVQQYTFTGLDPAADYNVSLFPCGNPDEGPSVLTDDESVLGRDGLSTVDGELSFRDQDADDLADNEGTTQNNTAVIATVGFTNIGAQTAVDASPAADGTLIVRVSSNGLGADCAIPVVYEDDATAGMPAVPTNNDQLDLNDENANTLENDNTPAEPFAVGPAVLFFGGEAPNGLEPEGDVLFLDVDENYFVDASDGFQYFYGGAGDLYYYDGDIGYDLTLAEFESYLSIGDNMSMDQNDGVYSRTNPNLFENEGDTPGTPEAATAAVGDFDGVGATTELNDIRVTVTPPAPALGDIDEYCVELTVLDSAGVPVSSSVECSDEVDSIGSGDADTVVVFEDQADGTYVARADAQTDGFESGDYSPYSAVATVDAVPNDAVRPTMVNAEVTDAGAAGVLDAGDVVLLDFSENLEAAGLLGPQTFTITDPQGETFTVTGTVALGDNPDAAPVNTTDRATITVTAVNKTGGVGDGVANLPSTINTLPGEFEDAAGNTVDVAGSADRVIDVEL